MQVRTRRPRRRRGAWLTRLLTRLGVLVCAALLALPAAASAAPAEVAPPTEGPAGDGFFTPPNPLPDGAPGDVIRFRKATATSWEVMYLSTNGLGERNAVTGTVLVPTKVTDLTTVPILGFAPGTTGPAFRCRASNGIKNNLLLDQASITNALNAGYAVAVSDYEGYSTTSTPTYIVGRSMGPAVLDAIRAAMRLPAAGLGTGPHKIGIQGYSQGGGAAMWAGEFQPTYAPELDLVGIAAGGVPADLNEVAKGLDGQIGFGFLAFAAVGLDSAYPELDLDTYLNDSGRATLAKARANDCVVQLLTNYAGQRISQYTTTNPINRPDWQARITENKLGTNPPKVPVYQYHGRIDQIVGFDQADALHKTYCAAGVTEQFDTFFINDHITGIFAGEDPSKKWLADRFAGKPAPSNC